VIWPGQAGRAQEAANSPKAIRATRAQENCEVVREAVDMRMEGIVLNKGEESIPKGNGMARKKSKFTPNKRDLVLTGIPT
jgi:hypothetical protein